LAAATATWRRESAAATQLTPMGLKLYGGARSRASMPRWYLEEKGLAYEWYRIGTQRAISNLNEGPGQSNRMSQRRCQENHFCGRARHHIAGNRAWLRDLATRAREGDYKQD
jgi:hypothetical protein